MNVINKTDPDPREELHMSMCLQAWYSSVSFCKQAGIEPLPQALNSSISTEELAVVVETDTAFSSPSLEVNAPTKARHMDVSQLLQVVS